MTQPPGVRLVTEAALTNPASAAGVALSATFASKNRALAQAARAPRIARVLDKFLSTRNGVYLGRSGTTYSFYYGWANGLFWKCDLVADGTEPGAFTLHQLRNQTCTAPMLTKGYDDGTVTSSGTYVLGTNAAAYNGKYTYSTVAGSFKQITLPVGATSAALRVPYLTNGGRFMVIAIDGDNTKATLLPTATQAVAAGQMASTSLVANGGTLNPTDRVFYSMATSAGATDYDTKVPLVTDLDPTATHTVKVTATAELAVGHPNTDRAYLAGFSYGTATSKPTDAGVIMLSLDVLNAINSAWEHACEYVPTGGTTATFLGNVHGYEEEVSFTIAVDGTVVTPADGSLTTVTRDVKVTRIGKLYHPDTGTTKIADTQVIYTMGRSGLTIEDQITWRVGGTLTKAYAMLPMEGAASNVAGAVKFTRGAVLDYPVGTLTAVGAVSTDIYAGHSKSAAAWMWGGNYGALIHVPNVEDYTNDWASPTALTMFEDRNGTGGRITKIYVPRTSGTAETVAAGDVHAYRSDILVSRFPAGAEATLAAL